MKRDHVFEIHEESTKRIKTEIFGGSEESKSNVLSFLDLPDDMIGLILSDWCSITHRAALHHTCNRLRNLLPKSVNPESQLVCRVEKLYYCVAKEGNLNLLSWLHKCGWYGRYQDVSDKILKVAALHGKIEVLKKLLKQGLFFRSYGKDFDVAVSELFVNAATNGHLKTMKWLYRKKFRWMVDHRLDIPAKNGDLPMLEWMYTKGYCNGSALSAFTAAARAGQLSALKWLKDHKYRPSRHTFHNAIAQGNMEVLEYLYEIGCPWNGYFCDLAARGGYLKILKWARAKGCPWYNSVCTQAVLGDHFNILKWARENGCPWDFSVCSYAAHYGRFEMLKWAVERGCPLTEMVPVRAINGKQWEILKWLRTQNCPWNKDLNINEALKHENKEIMSWLLNEAN